MKNNNSKKSPILDYYHKYLIRVSDLKTDLSKIVNINIPKVPIRKVNTSFHDGIYTALVGVSITLANSYEQVKIDLDNNQRISWSGTAHEIREIVTNLLRLLAPNDEITLESWYKQEKDSSGPTQKQRVKYILQKQSGGSKQSEVTELVTQIEGLVANMVRATYSRASDAAHRSKDRTEVLRLFKYFEAFAHDLLDIK